MAITRRAGKKKTKTAEHQVSCCLDNLVKSCSAQAAGCQAYRYEKLNLSLFSGPIVYYSLYPIKKKWAAAADMKTGEENS